MGRRSARLLLAVAAVGIALAALRALRAPQEDPVALHGEAMGTTWSVKVVADGASQAERREIRGLVVERLDEVNRRMSTYDPESELSRFNRHRSIEPFPVSPPTLAVFRVAQEVSEQTGGAFDVTVGPLVAAWGFGAGGQPEPPSPVRLEALRARVGHHLLRIDPEGGGLVKRHPELVCDLSAVAKGYAVDRVAEALAARGVADDRIEVGGETRARGERAGGGAWRVAIERPEPGQRSVFGVVALADAALATSGDYRTYRDRDGVRLSHLIDPRTGRPAAHRLASVSVLHPSAARADALATGLGVLGPDAGPALAERLGLAAYFIVRETDGALRGVATGAFPPVEGRPGAGGPG
ncbi:MAG: FAD:protein FMN transferase [Myxococcota bacterium]